MNTQEIVEIVAPYRLAIDTDGFAFVDNLSQEGRLELERLGYGMFHFAPYDEHRGEPVMRTVAAHHSRTYLDAQDWIWEALGLDKKAEAEKLKIKAGFHVIDIDNLSVTVQEEYVFDSHNDKWNDIHEHNMFYIKMIQNMYADRLNAWGYVFLNDVLASLGFPRTVAGQLIGWKQGDVLTFEFGVDQYNVITLKFPTVHYILDVLGA